MILTPALSGDLREVLAELDGGDQVVQEFHVNLALHVRREVTLYKQPWHL